MVLYTGVFGTVYQLVAHKPVPLKNSLVDREFGSDLRLLENRLLVVTTVLWQLSNRLLV